MARLPAGIRKRTGGGYEYRFTYKGVRYSVGGATVNDCKAKAKEKQDLLDMGIYQTNDKITLNKYFDEWIKQKESTVKGSSVLSYNNVYRNNIAPTLGKHKIKTLERRQIVSMLNQVAKEKGTGAANHARRILVAILNAAIRDDIIMRNVAAGIPMFKTTGKPARETIHRELTDQELKIFFKAVQFSRYYNAFRFMLYTGVRAGECCGLQWRDVDQKNGIIHIRKTVTRNSEGKWVLGETPKTRTSKRDIPINKAVREVLEEQWEIYHDTHDVLALNDFVFSGERDQIANTGTFRNIINLARSHIEKDMGIVVAPFCVHAFRDTFASRAIRAGVPPNTLKEILGHASLSMTMDLYAHVNQRDKIESMERMRAIDL